MQCVFDYEAGYTHDVNQAGEGLCKHRIYGDDYPNSQIKGVKYDESCHGDRSTDTQV